MVYDDRETYTAVTAVSTRTDKAVPAQLPIAGGRGSWAGKLRET